MKNKKQLFSLLLLASCSLVQQTVFAAAASANPPGGPKIDGSQGEIVPGDKLQKGSPEYKHVYNYLIGAGKNVDGKAIVGIKFSEIKKGLTVALEHENFPLLSALTDLADKSIYNESVNKEVRKEFEHFQNTDVRLRQWNPRLDDERGTPFEGGSNEKEKTENIKKVVNILWPLLVWAIEQNNFQLTYELYKIIGNKPKPYGNQRSTPKEIASFLGSENSLSAISLAIS